MFVQFNYLIMCAKTIQKYFFFLTLAFTACRESPTINRPDVSNIDLTIQIERFDQQLATLAPNDVSLFNRSSQEVYPAFYPDYMREILEVGDPKDTAYIQDILPRIIQRKEFKDLANSVTEKYPNLKQQEAELTQAFKYIKYYFPDYKIPRFIAYFAGFSVQTSIGDNYVGVGLDMFLGSDSEYYPSLVQSIPLYISRRFTPENITPRVVEAVLREDLFPQPDMTQNTLEYMIYNGKILYAMDIILAHVDDALKIGYTSEQLQWARRYQSDIWAWFLQEELLYSTDYQRIQKYFTEAPFTPELGENNQSAPKLGSYMGWLMVRKFMAKHPEMNLMDLFAFHNAQQILEDSKFKGKE